MVSACHEGGGGVDAVAMDTGTESETDTGSETETETAGETDTAQDSYPPGPYGTEVGDTIADLEFVRGNGEPLALISFFATPPPALIMFGTAAW